MKKYLHMFLAVVLIFSLTACDRQAKTPVASTTPADSENKIEDTVIIGGWHTQPWDKFNSDYILPDLEEQYPDTKWVFDSADSYIAKLEAMKNNMQWDVVYLTEPMTIKAIQAGLIDEYDTSKVPNYSQVVEVAKMEPYGPAILLGYCGIAYDKTKVKTPPTSFADLANPEYKDLIALPTYNNTSAVLFMAACIENNGGDLATNPEPGYEFLRSIKDNVRTTYNGDAAMLSLLERDEVGICVWWSGSAVKARDHGYPNIVYVEPAEGSPVVRTFANKTKGSPHPEGAYAFLNQLISKNGQTGMMEIGGYGPTNSTVEVPQDKWSYMPCEANLDKAVAFDWSDIIENTDKWSEEWIKLFGQ